MQNILQLKPFVTDKKLLVPETGVGILIINDNFNDYEDINKSFTLPNNKELPMLSEETQATSWYLDLSKEIKSIRDETSPNNYLTKFQKIIEDINKLIEERNLDTEKLVLVYHYKSDRMVNQSLFIKDIILHILTNSNVKYPFSSIIVNRDNEPFTCIYKDGMVTNQESLLKWLMDTKYIQDDIIQILRTLKKNNDKVENLINNPETTKDVDSNQYDDKDNINAIEPEDKNDIQNKPEEVQVYERVKMQQEIIVPKNVSRLNVSNFNFLTSKSRASRVIYDEEPNVSDEEITNVAKTVVSHKSFLDKPKEVLDGLVKKIKNILSDNPTKAKQASDSLQQNNLKAMSIYVNDALVEFENNIYPIKPKVQKEVLEKLDKWAADRGRLKPRGIDPVLTSTFIDRNVKSNIHRVMSQKEITWKNIPYQVEEMITPVLSDNGFKVLSVSVSDNAPNPRDIEPTYMSDIKVRIQNLKNRKIQTVKFMVPTLIDGKYHIQGGVKVLFPNVIATLPIFVVKPGKVQFKTNYSAMTFLHRINSRKDFVVVRVGGINMSLLIWLLQLKSLREIASIFGFKYQIVDNKNKLDQNTKWDYNIKLKNGRMVGVTVTASGNNEIRLCKAIINDMQPLVNKYGNILFDEFETVTDNNAVLISGLTTRRNVSYLYEKIKRYMIDVRNAQILRQRNINPSLIDVSKLCAKISVNDTDEGKMEISNTYIRLMDMIPGEIERAFHYGLTEYRRRSVMDPDVELMINPAWVINQLREQSVLLMYKDGNPNIELAQVSAVRLVGPGGFSKADSVQTKDRGIPSSQFGVLDPVDTAEGSPGEQIYLTSGFEYDPDKRVFNEPKKRNEYTNMFSAAASMIPFIFHDDGNRAQFGCSQTRQVVPIIGGESALVCTGMEAYVPSYASEKFMKKARADGVVTYVDQNCIILKYKDGTSEAIDIKPPKLICGSGHPSTLINNPLVKVGDSVKAFQQLTSNQFINKNGVYSSGFNVLAAFKTSKGFSYEDGVVISESFAKRATSLHYNEITLSVDSLSELKVFPTQRLKETGNMKYEAGEVIAKISVSALGGFQENNVVAPTTCEVTDIKIYPAKPEFLALVKEVDQLLYSKTNNALKQNGLQPLTNINTISDNIGKFQLKKELQTRTIIKISTVEYRMRGTGDKLNNRHGNKGVITYIEKDEFMPRLEDGRRIDILLNPLGVVGRANLGQLFEIHYGCILDEARLKIQKMPDDKARDFLYTVYTLLDASKDKSLSKNIIENLRNMNQTQLHETLEELRNHGIRVIARAGDNPKMVDINKAAEFVGAKLKQKLFLPEYGRWTINECAVGVLHINCLEHISELKQNSRSIGRYIQTSGLPAKGGHTIHSQNAIRLGELDTDGLLAYPAKTVLNHFFLINSNNQSAKNMVIDRIINDGEAELSESDLLQLKESGSSTLYNVLHNVIGLEMH